MTVAFYQHSPVEDVNERRALCKVARNLKTYLDQTEEKFYLVANINPQGDSSLPPELTQLDGMLLGPNSVSILEFKTCYEPFDGRNL